MAASIMLSASWLITGPMMAGARGEEPDGLTEAPFGARSAAAGPTMFTAMRPERTGVHTENRYADPRMWGSLYQEFEGGSVGTGVTIGDYDGDGRPDLFVVAKTETCRLFHNLGDFHFEDVTDKAGVADTGPAARVWKNGATFVDVNNDGRLDLYVCRFDAPNLLYINQGDGTFKEMAHALGLDVTDSSVMASFADYDRDGRLDVYIATNVLDSTLHPQGQRGYLFHQQPDGTFANVTGPAGINGAAQSHSATWWDYDNDGWPDLYVANDYGAPDHLYHNNRDGTFTDVIDRVLPHTAFYSMGSDLGDVNNDGLVDFLVADMSASSRYNDQHTLAESRGSMLDPVNYLLAPKYQRSALLLNTGTGRCLEAGFLAGIASTDWTWGPHFEDLDNDGRIDFFVTNGFNRDPNPDVHERAMRAESSAQRIKILHDTEILAQANFAFRNLGDLQFANVSHAWGLDHKGVSFADAFGDLDGDGDLDLVYSNYGEGVSVFRNDCATGHRVIIDLRGTASNRFGIGAVVRIETASGVQVRELELARSYMASGEPAVHFGLGDDAVIRRLTVAWPSGRRQEFADLPADCRFTITEPSGPVPAGALVPRPAPPGQFVETWLAHDQTIVSREEPIDELSTQRLLPARFNRRGPALAVGAIAPGPREAVVLGGTTLDPLRVLQMTSPDQVQAAPAVPDAPPANVNDGPVLVFDADGDGVNDLFVTHGGNSLPAGVPDYEPSLYLNRAGAFKPAAEGSLPDYTASVGAAVAADFNRDGTLDVFLGGRITPEQYPQSPDSALWANHGGRFEDVTDAVAPALRRVGMVTGALWSDVDDDGWPDLLVTLEWGPVKYFHNDHGRRLEDWTERSGFISAGTGWWTGLAAADFNGDGRMDYVLGNAGLNTQYHADAQHPAVLLAGDFAGSGTSQLVEATYEGDTLYPWRSRRTLAASIPWILRRFPTNESYARATLHDIFTADQLAAATKYAATELRSGVLLSQPDGTYRFAPLPRLAQIAPLQGIATGDFDGDGHADIYAVQNSYAPIAPVGRFDGGLSQLLRGDGHGGFAPVPVAASGLLVTGDAKALVALDLDDDGWADFVVSRNFNTLLAFHNRGVAGHHPLAVRLEGPAGNPTAVGARVTVEFADGTRATAEVNAGSGYYSQSSPVCFFGYPTGNPPKAVHVRWPDGTQTTHAAPPDRPVLIFHAPAS